MRDDVLKFGWSEEAGSFVRGYGRGSSDATAQLIPLMGFLPPDNLRVRATVERVETVLSRNGLAHRFVPEKTSGRFDQPMGDREGALFMRTMWLAEAWHMLGETRKVGHALERAEACRSMNRLCSEVGHARHPPELLDNMPLLFTEAARVRAAMAIA